METCDEPKKKPKQKFFEGWLSDDRYKSWIRHVPDDNTSFYCSVCNKKYSCSSHVSRHVNSACHTNNMKEHISGNKNEILKNKKPQYNRTFKSQWLDITYLQPWLCEVPDSANLFHCLFCNRSIAITSSGLSQIYRHAESQLHKQNSEKSDRKTNESDIDLNTQIDESLLTFDERKKSAEIRFAALITEKNIPHQTAQAILRLFQDIG